MAAPLNSDTSSELSSVRYAFAQSSLQTNNAKVYKPTPIYIVVLSTICSALGSVYYLKTGLEYSNRGLTSEALRRNPARSETCLNQASEPKFNFTSHLTTRDPLASTNITKYVEILVFESHSLIYDLGRMNLLKCRQIKHHVL